MAVNGFVTPVFDFALLYNPIGHPHPVAAATIT